MPDRLLKKDGRPDGPLSGVRIAAATAGLGGIAAVVLQLALFFAGIQSSLDRNCYATNDLATATAAVVGIDNELNQPKNEQLRKQLVRSLASGVRCDDDAIQRPRRGGANR